MTSKHRFLLFLTLKITLKINLNIMFTTCSSSHKPGAAEALERHLLRVEQLLQSHCTTWWFSQRLPSNILVDLNQDSCVGLEMF